MADEKSTDENTETKEETKSSKAPLPEGYLTPVAFAKTVTRPDGKDMAPQIIYGYIKNNGPDSKNPFPAKQNTDGAWMVHVKDATAWLKELQDRKAKRAAEKAAKEKEAAAKQDDKSSDKAAAAKEAAPAK